MNVRRGLRTLVTVVAALTAGAGRQAGLGAQSPPTSQVCVTCHLGLDDPRLSQPAKDFPKDIHAELGFGCLDCHGVPPGGGPLDPAVGFLHAPARRDIPALCGRCHSDAAFMKKYDPSLRVDQVAEYWTSDHGRRLKELDDPDVATCADCHRIHRIRPPSDPTAKTYPLNVPETCGACHADPKRMAKHHLPTDQLEKFKNSVHGKLIYEKGDLSAPVCNDCHGNHGAQPPGVSSVEYVCGQCHTVMEQFFDENGHKEAFAKDSLPGCATCHNHHDIQPVADSDLLVREKQVCRRCHAAADTLGRQFEVMKTLLDSLTASDQQARSLLEKAENSGMEVSQALFELDDVKNALTKARSTVHSFDAAAVHKEVDAGLAVTTAGLERGRAAMVEHRYRREGLAISAGVILLLIAGLIMKIRDTEARTERVESAVGSFFRERLRLAPDRVPVGEEVRLTACALLLEASSVLPGSERARIDALVRTQFGLPMRDVERLMEVVTLERTGPGEQGRIAALVAEEYTREQVRAAVEEMWFLVFVDQSVARGEIDLLEQVAKLLHLERDEVAAARRTAGMPAARGRPRSEGREEV